MSPRVSVIVAARDAVATLPQTLGSVQAQTFEDWEIVVVDDGSADRTGDVARSSGDRVRVLRNERAEGPGAARNRGVREARGELIAMLDSDDAWLPPYLERQVAALDAARAAGRRVGAVCCDAFLVGPDGPTGQLWSERVGRADRVDLDTLLRENVVFTSVLCPRDVFLELSGYDPDPRLGVEDYDLWLRMVERGWEIVVNPEPLAHYRLGGEARSAKVERMAAGAALVLDRTLGRGNLTPSQRRLARKRRRVFRVVELRARSAAQASPLRRLALAARTAPLLLLSALEHPERWRHWLREGPRSVGARRHTG